MEDCSLAESSLGSKRGSYARSETTKARILEAAMAIATESGFQNLSVAAVASRAGVALGNVNYHFGTKNRLLTELMVSRVNDFASRLAPKSAGESFFSYERAVLKTYLEFLHDNPTYVRLAEEIRHIDPELYEQGTRLHVDAIAARIEAAIAQGELRQMTGPELLCNAYLMQGAYSFLDRFLQDERYPGDEQLLDAVMSFIADGLATDS